MQSEHLKLRQAIGELLGWEIVYDEHEIEYVVRSTKDHSEWCRCHSLEEAIDRLPDDPVNDIGDAMMLLNDPRVISVSIDKNCSGIGWCVSVNNTADRPCRDFDYLALTICLAWHEAVSGRKWKEPTDAE